VEAVQKTLDILETFLKRDGEIGITELSSMSGLNISTTYRIATDLTQRGYLKQKQKRGKYSVGIKLLEFNRVVQSNFKIAEIAFPFMQKLSQLSGEYSEIAIMDSNSAVTLAQIEVRHNLRIANNIGERLPLHATSLGRVLLAYMKEDERKRFYSLQKLTSFTPNTITDINRLERQLERVRRQGYSVDSEEYSLGVWSISAPIYDSNHSVVAAICISAPSARIDSIKVREYERLIRRSSLDISRELGY
jgi:IclR family KDG regulon transcriptional repressor